MGREMLGVRAALGAERRVCRCLLPIPLAFGCLLYIEVVGTACLHEA